MVVGGQLYEPGVMVCVYPGHAYAALRRVVVEQWVHHNDVGGGVAQSIRPHYQRIEQHHRNLCAGRVVPKRDRNRASGVQRHDWRQLRRPLDWRGERQLFLRLGQQRCHRRHPDTGSESLIRIDSAPDI